VWGLGTVLSAANANNSGASFFLQVDGTTGPTQTINLPNSGITVTTALSYRTPTPVGPTGGVPIVVWGKLNSGNVVVNGDTVFGLGNLS
jgi:hypothetical protein